MSESDRERAQRIINLLIQYTRPGQIQIPFHWVNDDESKQNTVSHKFYVDDDVNVLNDSGSGIVESSQEKDLAEVKLEDGEIDDEIDDVERKENVVSSANTSFNSSNGSYNGSCSNNNIEKPRSAKEEAKRQKFGHVICKFFREGHCREGNSCCYSHNASDSHRLPELCKGYIIGKCRKALKCNLLHGEHPCKDYHFGLCNVLKCRFSHQPLNDYTKAIFEKALKDEEDAIAAAAVNTIPRFPLFQSNAVPVNCPPQIFPHHSHPFSTSMKTNPSSLAYNKKAFRQKVAHPYNKKLSKPISPLQNSTAANEKEFFPLPELCKGYIIGKCRKALKCNLLHGEHPCKDYHFGLCNVLKCRFSHQPLNDYTKAIFEKALKDEEDAIAAAAVNTIPRFPLFQSNAVPVNCPPQIFPHHSHPFSTSMKTNPSSLAYNKKAFRQKVAHPYNKKLSKPISPLQNSTAANEKGMLFDVGFNLPRMSPQAC